jgi:leucyl aminopeptidase
MKTDMSGAAVVMGVMQRIASYNANVNLTIIVPSAENAIGSKAYKVGDVYSSYHGTSVEIKNTDAEGRLVLADAISWANDNIDSEVIVDVATLTGAVISALGNDIAGVFTNPNSESYLDFLKESSQETGEQIWQLPLNDKIKKGMKSDIADICNMSSLTGQHGASSAAAFLSHFVDDSNWIHVDIAGTARNKSGGTGFGVELLSDFVLSLPEDVE